jgi:prepilin-type N-terminal cleavage/methylation domain-containing protein
MNLPMLRVRFIKNIIAANTQGFTFLEVVLVLVIVSILSVVVIANNSSTAAKAKLLGEVALLKTQLRYTQARALNANQVWGMTANGNQVWLFNGGDTNNRVDLPGENTDLVDYNTDQRKSGLSVSGVPSPFIVSFDDRGQPYTDAAADEANLAAAPVSVAVSDGTTTIQIDITPNTGFIQ